MTQEQTAPTRVRRRPNFRTVHVSRVNRLTRHLVRVTLAGPELEGFETNGPAEHIRVWFPQSGREKPLLPEWGPEGPMIPEGHERPVNRVYTPRRWDPEKRELDVEIVLHGEGGATGPGAGWALNAKPGDFVTVTGPGGPYRGIDNSTPWYVIAGDQSALPAIATILEALPATTHADVLVEVEDEADELQLESAAPFSVRWLHSGPNNGPTGRLIEAALRDFDWSAAPGRVFIACEAGVMRDIRKQLIYERGFERDSIHTHGYWKHGETNHPDHDLGQDV